MMSTYKHIIIKGIICCMMCSCFWLKAVGQERAQTYGIDSVIITGQYTPQTAEKAIHAIRTISSEKINRMAAVNLGDVLSNELNIRLSQDNILGQSLSIQGLSGENVKILIDGVPVIGRQNGNIDLGQLNLLGIERIEIVEGPLSVNYGTQALAGTINLITKKPRKASTNLEQCDKNMDTASNVLSNGRRRRERAAEN